MATTTTNTDPRSPQAGVALQAFIEVARAEDLLARKTTALTKAVEAMSEADLPWYMEATQKVVDKYEFKRLLRPGLYGEN